MKRAIFHSLRFRLAALNLLMAGLILTIAFIFILQRTERELRRDFDRWLNAETDEILRDLLADAPESPLAARTPLEVMSARAYYIQLRGEDGRVVRKSRALRGIEVPLSQRARQVRESGGRFLETISDTSPEDEVQQRIRLLTMFWQEPGRAPFYLQVGSSLDRVEHVLQDQQELIAITLPLVLVAVGFGAWFLASRSLSPLQRIAEEARRYTVERLGERIGPTSVKGDLAEVVESVNMMLERLEQGFRRQERFLADVSHELKTPVAVLLAQAQVLSRKARTPEEYDEFAASVEGEMQRLSEIINSFLLLSRATAGSRTSLAQTVSLNDVVTQAIQRCNALASHREIKLLARLCMPGSEGPDPEVVGDEELLCSMLANLILNAIRYSPVGEPVEVELAVREGQAMLTVRDRGPGLPADLLPRLFEPFSAASCGGPKGVGLGLAIARSVAELHAGRISVNSGSGAGCEFCVSLPLGRS